MFRLALFVGFCYLINSVATAPSPIAPRGNSAEPLLPSEDNFYTAPDGFEETAPGTIFCIRSAPGNITTVIANTSAAYNIVYRTTDSNYAPSWAVTTILSPLQNNTAKGNISHHSLLSLQTAYNTANHDSTPSLMLYCAASQTSLGIPWTADDISAALGNGWYVNMSDHEGPLSSFGLGVEEGHETLNSKIIASDKETNTFAAELHEQYAPEMHFSGMAIGVFFLQSILGITFQNGVAREYLISCLEPLGPYNSTAFLAALNYDVNVAFAAYYKQDICDYFIGGPSDLQASVIQDIANRNSNEGYHGTPLIPVFAYKVIHETVNTLGTLLTRWCGISVDVRYDRNEVGRHITDITNGRLRALEWLKGVFKGHMVQNGCEVKNLTVTLTDNTR
ncbi:hypothetical protein P280DRAFT_526901 [Massarina eburnea CBS 473.64]|uniref:Alpha/beta-hydrolase n=1 Tax=Massarina eburnea CBS 473.64 TaxID=1395130 RepID=A0A6A6RWF3_9PLEO|nr:hypothetical protein P280DRAFT_526901 [Massarina eburnea CBS 473.64]